MAELDRYLARRAIFEELLRTRTWFTEGATSPAFRNSGTLGEGWLQRYGVAAVVHELNCNWIEGRKDFTSSRHWLDYGGALAEVFHDYFVRAGLDQPSLLTVHWSHHTSHRSPRHSSRHST